MQEKTDRGTRRDLRRQPQHKWKEQKMVVVDPDNVTFLKLRDDSIGETLINGNVLFIRCGFIKIFGFRCVWNGVVKARPQNLASIR